MAEGDVANPRIWTDADVYVADVGTVGPADLVAAWGAGWEPLGLLSDDGMTESRDDDETDHFAWGGKLVRTTRSKHKRTFTVTVLENNPAVWGLVNPGSDVVTAAGVTTRTVKVPSSNPKAFGLQWVDGDVTRRRIIPRGEVSVSGDVEISDSDMESFELTIAIYPAADGTLYVDLTDDPQAVEAA